MPAGSLAPCADGPTHAVLGHVADGFVGWIWSLMYLARIARWSALTLVEPCVEPDGRMRAARASALDERGCLPASAYWNVSSLGVPTVPRSALLRDLERASTPRCRVAFLVPPARSCKLGQRAREFLPRGALSTGPGYALLRSAPPASELEALELASALRRAGSTVLVLAAEWTSALSRVHAQPAALWRARWLRACEPHAPGAAVRGAAGATPGAAEAGASGWLPPSAAIWAVARAVQREELRGSPYVAAVWRARAGAVGPDSNSSACAALLRARTRRAAAAVGAAASSAARGAAGVTDVPVLLLTDALGPCEAAALEQNSSEQDSSEQDSACAQRPPRAPALPGAAGADGAPTPAGWAAARAAEGALLAAHGMPIAPEPDDGAPAAWLRADSLVRARLSREPRALGTAVGVQLGAQLLAAHAHALVALERAPAFEGRRIDCGGVGPSEMLIRRARSALARA